MNFIFKESGNNFVAAFISLFQKPTMTFLLPFSAARRLLRATTDGGSAASLPHVFCPRICSRMSSRVGIAPGKIAVTVILLFLTSRESDSENDVSAPFVAEYTAKYGMG